jgi:tyrosyl-tRNA synthetase
MSSRNPEQFQEILRTPQKREMTIEEALTRSVDKVAPQADGLAEKMAGERIKLYLGIDPTSPELHIGHTVPLRKLRHFQDLGHEVNLLFGTFTGQIGDPTDKSATRVRLTPEQIETNVASYAEQASKILDLAPDAQNPISIVYNHEWLGKLTFAEIVDIASNFTVQQFESRSMFDERREKGVPIWLHEYLYPLMQGWDSVAMGVDVEVGGTDQTFNMLAGRKLVERYLDKEKWVVATKLIADPSGKKMGKTEGNIVNVSSFPEVKFESMMTWPDSAIPLGFELLTTLPMEEVEVVKKLLESGEVNPMKLKEALAYRVVAELDGVENAEFAGDEFDRVIRKKEQPSRMQEVQTELGATIASLVVSAGLARSEEEAQTLLRSGSIYVDGKQVPRDFKWDRDEGVLQVGKKSIKNVRRVTRK